MRLERRSVDVFDMPSGTGGSFTVSVVEEVAADRVRVRVWYGRAPALGWEAWKDWDGYTFEAERAALTNQGLCRFSERGRADGAAFTEQATTGASIEPLYCCSDPRPRPTRKPRSAMTGL
ncbi:MULTISPECIES: hypothetical protein [Rhizobium]|uniref:hypothetical protein n=1 Tax=Rhizobium TaxID=379 RepID=UPI001FF3B944|nr:MULTISPECIES: hypothetical protein [Rhizobium]